MAMRFNVFTGTFDYTGSSSAGGVTSISASGGTLTITPTVGTVLASINLANANNWTGQQHFAPAPSSTGGGSRSERYGQDSLCFSTDSVAVGQSANAGSNGCVIIGSFADASGHSGSVALGMSAAPAFDASFVSGSDTYPISLVHFGKGGRSSAATAYTIAGTYGLGTNNAGADLKLAGGAATGTAAGGSLLFQTSDVIGSGSTLQTQTTKVTIDSFGRLIMNGAVSVIRIKGYTVAALPAGTAGDMAYCTDLLAPAFFAVVVGGGAVVGPVFYDGANWKAF